MKSAANRDMSAHPGISFHKMPVAGVGGALLSVAVILVALIGLPIAKWFLLGSLVLAWAVVGFLVLMRKLNPKTEVEEVQLKVSQRPGAKAQ